MTDLNNLKREITETDLKQQDESLLEDLKKYFSSKNVAKPKTSLKIAQSIVFISNKNEMLKSNHPMTYKRLITDYLGIIFSYLESINADNLETLLFQEIVILEQIIISLTKINSNQLSDIEITIEIQQKLKSLLEEWILLTKRNYYDKTKKYRTTDFIKKTLRGDIRYFFVLCLGIIKPFSTLKEGLHVIEKRGISRLNPKRNTLNIDSLLLALLFENAL